ncbi:MAG: zinc-binding dehydrogenase [Micromonosporaceae bacterium]|nr:zinc-binding dehydrogenase [Micromonosporaceae bacterium]
MYAVYAKAPNPTNPLAALAAGERSQPQPAPGWVLVQVRAASLNMHDVNTLRGVRMDPARYPMILGCDGSGELADGTEVVLHSCVPAPGWVGPEELDPGRTVLSERYPGSFAEAVAVPERNAVPKPASMSHIEAACLPTAWLTAYRMLFVNSRAHPGQTILVDARDRLGSINGAVVALARKAGFEVWVATGRDRDRVAATELGAHRVFPAGKRPDRLVDAVFDAGIDEAGWSHATDLVRPGGTVVCAGWRSGTSTIGYRMALDDLIFREVRVVGSTMGTVTDLANLLAFLDRTGLRPQVAGEFPLSRAGEAIGVMLAGRTSGKLVLTA